MIEEVVRTHWGPPMLRAALTEGMAKPDQELLRAWMLRNRAWTLDPAGAKVMVPRLVHEWLDA